MRRDWDLLRRIMLQVEELPDSRSLLFSDGIRGVDAEAAFYHMRLLIEAGLAEGDCQGCVGSANDGTLCRLTWQGHELLDHIRRDTIWNRVKETVRKKSLDLSLEVIKAAAIAILTGVL